MIDRNWTRPAPFCNAPNALRTPATSLVHPRMRVTSTCGGGGATRDQMDAPGSFLGLTPRPLFSRFIDFQLASWSCMIAIERLPRASR